MADFNCNLTDLFAHHLENPINFHISDAMPVSPVVIQDYKLRISIVNKIYTYNYQIKASITKTYSGTIRRRDDEQAMARQRDTYNN